MNNFGIIIEARTASTRLPNKVLLKLGKISVLEYLIKRLKPLSKTHKSKIIIATTLANSDSKIVDIVKKTKVNVYRGSSENVLQRVIRSAEKFNVQNIIRITSDCPLIDISLVDQAIRIFNHNDVDIVTNGHIRSYPDGMDVEIIKLKALKRNLILAGENKEFLEHLTLGMKKYKNKFTKVNIIAPKKFFFPKIGITLDEPNDYVLITKIYNYFKREKIEMNCENILNFLNKNKKIYNININVKRTKYSV